MRGRKAARESHKAVSSIRDRVFVSDCGFHIGSQVGFRMLGFMVRPKCHAVDMLRPREHASKRCLNCVHWGTTISIEKQLSVHVGLALDCSKTSASCKDAVLAHV